MNATVLLLDADGVVQEGDPGFRASLEALCPEPAKVGEFVAGVFAAERPCATGERDFAEALGEVLNRWNIPGTLDEALSCWERVEPSGQVLDFVAELRGAGTVVALATNQQNYRARVLRELLAYDDHFDALLISCELGFVKPTAGFFGAACARLGIDRADALFVDDAMPNVLGAREAGLAAEHDHLSEGVGRLRALWAQHAVPR